MEGGGVESSLTVRLGTASKAGSSSASQPTEPRVTGGGRGATADLDGGGGSATRGGSRPSGGAVARNKAGASGSGGNNVLATDATQHLGQGMPKKVCPL